jgi:proliferating cell nuclear antigen
MGKILKATTEHTEDIKMVFEILKEVVHHCKLNFVQDPKQKQKIKKNVIKKSKNNDDTDNESDTDDEYNKKNNKQNETEANDDNEENEENETNEVKTEEKQKIKKNKVEGGIRIIEIDEHETLLVYVKLNASNFIDFYVKYPEYSVGLDLQQLNYYLKNMTKDNVLKIYVDKDDEQNIVFEGNNDVAGSNIKHTQKVMDLDNEKKNLPTQSNFEMIVTISTAEFHNLCRNLTKYSEYIEITCTKKELKFSCKGDSAKVVKKFTNKDNGVRIDCLDKTGKKANIFHGIYELRHLVTFGKSRSLCDEMCLYLKNDYPLFIQYSVGVIGKMLIALIPIDGKELNTNADYNEQYDKFYENKKAPVLK